MKSMIKSLLILLLSMLLCACGNNIEPEILGTTEFAEMIITFYHNPSIANNDGIYYSSDANNYTYDLHHTLKNKDQTQLFYVDYSGTLQAFENNLLIQPKDSIIVKNNDLDQIINVYHFDTDKQYILKYPNQKKFRISPCVASETGKSGVCTGELDQDGEVFYKMMKDWKIVQRSDYPIESNQLKSFLEITYNYLEIGPEPPSYYDEVFRLFQLEDGTLIVSDSKETYYHLTIEQTEDLNQFLSK